MSIGDRIKAKRLDLKLTQQDLSNGLHITPQHISAIEQNKRLPSLSMLEKLAEELGVTIDYLVTGRESILSGLLPAIKADPRLSLRARKALASIIEELHDHASAAEKVVIRKIASDLPARAAHNPA
ncbi:helix-turn-helix domain-containing protein [Dehalogenimonas etheniformans]|uniref:XRE family transcriptional regulator n=1 Tax=Dehalogenimonas etheniformans TaxID=1536648 RepID=A0A2P5P5F9_9CHLR|nr:helix-turn-helix transcriptional regulator [Dehalogenimonas etheniformans]PPD57529.1 XRE family transcriptional regulator [Dehalogenimonas etheniformans]QNT76890.1 helix-turn-helix transcriptional regulator [Dehalogenimonas etheniformans]